MSGMGQSLGNDLVLDLGHDAASVADQELHRLAMGMPGRSARNEGVEGVT
jgi:hypothetical protein